MIVDARAGHAGRYRVFLDDLDISDDCFWADDEAGVVKCFKRNDSGHKYLDADDEIAWEERRGVVQIIPAEAS